MRNKLLQKLEDTKNRKFPLIYKHVVETINDKHKDEIDSDFVFISIKKDSKLQCLDYYKPISKVLTSISKSINEVFLISKVK